MWYNCSQLVHILPSEYTAKLAMYSSFATITATVQHMCLVITINVTHSSVATQQLKKSPAKSVKQMVQFTHLVPSGTFCDHIEAITMEDEDIAAEPSADEADARRGSTGQLSTLLERLFAMVMACGNRLVMLAPRLITNKMSNLVEYYMSIHCYFDVEVTIQQDSMWII